MDLKEIWCEGVNWIQVAQIQFDVEFISTW